jgi:tRNA U34 5-methylaminomethyl-2-thiouridine-forming methyltransferase MnmC
VAREIILTGDGSHSLLHRELNETYHSVHGAIRESRHVFIENGLLRWWNENGHSDVNILEIGFGTGLNALLALQEANALQCHINYATLEAFPLSKEVWSKLNYTELLGDKELFVSLHELSWNAEHELLPSFRIGKHYETLQSIKFLPDSFDVVFFDAFGPAKQPEMWTLEMLSKVALALNPGGIFVTYCARGQLKRDLKNLDFMVETLPGPPGKKEMVRAIKK